MDNKDYKILIIDDDAWVERIMYHHIKSWGFTPYSTTDPIEGIALAVRHRPLLIFLDIYMPEINGYTLLKLLKKIDETSDIPVIIVSGNINKDILGAAYKHGAVSFVSKPFSAKVLFDKINEIVHPDVISEINIDLTKISDNVLTKE